MRTRGGVPRGVAIAFANAIYGNSPSILGRTFSLSLAGYCNLSYFCFQSAQKAFSKQAGVTKYRTTFSFFSIPIFPISKAKLSIFRPRGVLWAAVGRRVFLLLAGRRLSFVLG